MRRIILGSLGLSLGIFASSANAQDSRNAPPAQRTARLGRPVAIAPPTAAANSSGDTGVTPAGLLTPRSGDIPVPAPMPANSGGALNSVPIGNAPPAGTPMRNIPTGGIPTNGVVMNGVPTGVPLPNLPPGARIVGPSIVEDRLVGSTGALSQPTPVPPGSTIVPSVGGPGVPMVDGQQYGDCASGDCGGGAFPVGEEAFGRLGGVRSGRSWVSAEYLMWWTQAAQVPALVTTSSPAAAGRLGVGDTRVLAGAGGFGQTYHSGLRVGAGHWFGEDQVRGVDMRIFVLGQAESNFFANTNQYPLLARPFNNVNPNTPNFGSSSEIIADSVRATGAVQVHLENQAWGAELNYRRLLCGNPCASGRLEGLIGYRYFNMQETLWITENFTAIPGGGSAVASGVVTDYFRTTNEFHGGQIGLAGSITRGRWTVDGRATVAFGNLTRSATISGSQSLVLNNGTPVNANGGLLAIPGANIGSFSDSVFAVIPEVGLNVGYQLTSRMRVFVGYNFLYLGNALRPGAVIDTNVDAARIPNFLPGNPAPIAGTPRPAPQIRSSDFFIQGISFGLQFNW